MSTAGIIRQFVETAGAQIFTSSQFLDHGTRNAVDKALSRFVKSGLVKRLANGVFASAKSNTNYTSTEIIVSKAAAFSKRVSKTNANLNSENPTAFLTNGCTSSFGSIKGRLEFKHASNRRIDKLENKVKILPEFKQVNPALVLLSLAMKIQNFLKGSPILPHLVSSKRLKSEVSLPTGCSMSFSIA